MNLPIVQSAPDAVRQEESLAGSSTRGVRPADSGFFSRELIETAVVAIVLALLFRTFEAEAFVIPTGSMAPTLQGRHKDVACSECGFRYRGGSSLDQEISRHDVVRMTCPMCQFPMRLDPHQDLNHQSFTGDRILVNKFVYELGEPQRWDVIVFKFPGNAKQNYIKRLVGLPGETVRIQQGDIFIRRNGEGEFQIARKPPRKLLAMMDTVHDTAYVAPRLRQAGWPSRWAPMSAESAWKVSEDQTTFTITGGSDETVAWLGYQHRLPEIEDWSTMDAEAEGSYSLGPPPQLISDYYAYNACRHEKDGDHDLARATVPHWVGDLGLEVELILGGDAAGEVHLELIEGGRHHDCRIDTFTGEATLSIDQGAIPFVSDQGPIGTLTARIGRTGPGRYRLRLTNVDDQIRLWVDGRLVDFGHGVEADGIFQGDTGSRPRWSEHVPGDLIPVRVGARGVDATITNLRVLRDVYYIASNNPREAPATDYDRAELHAHDLADLVRHVFRTPQEWSSTPLFPARRTVEFSMSTDAADPSRDQFFPLGDNSPQSNDARLWHHDYPQISSAVERRLLTGKAFCVYWPHPWYLGVRWQAWVPHPGRMGLIR